MLWVVLAAWVLLSVAAAAVFHLARSRTRPVSVPPEVIQFLRRFEAEVRDSHPDVTIRGLLPGRFGVVLNLSGQECPVSLHQLFRRCEAFPDRFGEMVGQFLQELASEDLETTTDHEFADVAAEILPQIRSRQWLVQNGGVFGDSGLVYRALCDDLVVCYVVDEPWCMTFVCRAHLRQWGRTEEDLYHLATRNLHRLAGADVPTPTAESGAVVLRTGDGFDAARLLLLEPEQVDGLLLAVPDRDVLWLGTDTQANLSELMLVAQQQSEGARHPVSPLVYRMSGGGMVPVTAADTEAAVTTSTEP